MNKEEFRREVKEKAIKAQELMFTRGPTTKGILRDLEKYQKELKWADLYTKNQVKEIVKQCLSDENIATHYLNRY